MNFACKQYTVPYTKHFVHGTDIRLKNTRNVRYDSKYACQFTEGSVFQRIFTGQFYQSSQVFNWYLHLVDRYYSSHIQPENCKCLWAARKSQDGLK